ncbi:MAG TPA: hypothetical protein VGS28_03275 [Candidatus Saccharimonadales bacterium]|nr:hypothetical protein [Candidatus Saccharimonadales bacterium]
MIDDHERAPSPDPTALARELERRGVINPATQLTARLPAAHT